MTTRPTRRRSPEHERVRHLVLLDARTVRERLFARLPRMVALFSRLRDRDALLTPVAALGGGVRFEDLVVFEPAEQQAIVRFNESVADLRWYLRWTEDMPGTLEDRLAAFARDVFAAHDALEAACTPPVKEKRTRRPAEAGRRARTKKRSSR